MTSSTLLHYLLCFFLAFLVLGPDCPSARAQLDEASVKLVTDNLDLATAMTMYQQFNEEDGEDDEDEMDVENGYGRRSLFWRRMRYYISYGALSANRIPCPPRSGRSYYTNNCFKARGPVHPYSRGCSRITRCRRTTKIVMMCFADLATYVM
ncbi:hypothetical protein ACLB2K_001324 [Fragaria x ananassa]